MLTLLKNQVEVLEAETVEATEVFNHFAWDVKENNIYSPTGLIIPNYKSLERTDNGEILNVCKQSYSPISNEIFSEFVYKLAQVTGFEIKSFDEYHGGKKVLAYLKAPEMKINGYPIENYICIGNSHDSTSALFVANTTNMIRCQNRFSYFKNSGLRVSHTSGNNARLQDVERMLKLYQNQQSQLTQNFDKLQATKANKERLYSFVNHMFDLPIEFDYSEKAFELVSNKKILQMNQLFEAIDTEAADLGKNDFALFNGVTRWTSHTRPQKNATFGNLFGSNAILNQKALEFLLN